MQVVFFMAEGSEMPIFMNILRKINKLRRSFLSEKIRQDILNSRGNLSDSFPSDFTEEEKACVSFVRGTTMTSLERLVSLSRAVDYIEKNGIAGDIVECGVWRGGSMMLIAKKLLLAKSENRHLFLFDTFEGMSEPDKRDVNMVDNKEAAELLEQADKMEGANVWAYSPLDEVKSNLSKTGYNAAKISFIKGKVEDTLPHPSIEKIALLRLDTDWYESTKHELECLYDKLVPGGILIIDDYGHWSGSKQAVDEFIEKRKLNLFLTRMDYTGRLAVKH